MVPYIGCYFLKMSTLFIWGFVSSQPLIAISVKKKIIKKGGEETMLKYLFSCLKMKDKDFLNRHCRLLMSKRCI